MAGYKIIHIENKWVVCVEQSRLLSFDRKWKAMKTIQAAAKSKDPPVLHCFQQALAQEAARVADD
jgi:hypothetical protein